MLKWVVLLTLLTSITPAGASVDEDLNHFFDDLGMATNATAPHSYQGQAAGYYSGGSLYARNSVKNVELAHIDLPSIKAGCGGIDLFAGGFSFVNSQELVAAFENILNNAEGYGFTIALEEVSPQIANVMKYLQDMANKVNSMNINSCETAEALVDGAWGQLSGDNRKFCQDVGSSQGMFDDYLSAREGCTTDQSKYNAAIDKAKADPAYRDLVLDDVNLAWKAIQKSGYAKGNTELMELMMTLSGSIIVKKNPDGSGNSFANLSAQADDPSLLKALMTGGDARIYRCDETEKCLNPSFDKARTIHISENSSLRSQVLTLLEDIHSHIDEDTRLSSAEIGFLQSTTLPIYKMLTVQAAFAKDSSILDLESYADVIAVELLYQYLRENLTIVRQTSALLLYPPKVMNQFNHDVEHAMTQVRQEEQKITQKVNASLQLIEQTKVIEQMLSGQLSSDLSNTLSWAQGMHS